MGLSFCDKASHALVDAATTSLYAGISPEAPKTMATAEEELNQIEKDIRTLKIEYEQFFGGGRKRPPSDTQWRVETMIKRYSDRSGDLTFGQRFRYNNLTQTYAKYQDMWRKKLMQKEGAVTERHFGAAARAIEAERARQAAVEKAHPPPPPLETHSRDAAHHDAIPHEAERHAAKPAASAAADPNSFAMSFSDPEHERDKVKKLYQKLIEARAKAGEKTAAPTLKDFERFVRQKTKDLKQQEGQEVEYSVSIEAGRVKLKARISS